MSSDKVEAAAALDEWWKDIVDFDDVRGTDSSLFPQVYWNLGSRIRDAKLGARLKGTARHHWVKNQYLIASGGALLDLLRRAEVPVLLLKGAAIAATMDDDPGLRTMSDCDMLILKTQALEVVDILTASGLLTRTKVGERDLNVIHGVTLKLRRGQHAFFDIHWRPLRAVGADELAREMFGAAKRVDFAGRACLAPCPEHLLFHAIVHGTEWSPYPRYDWLVDAIKILRRTGSRFDWEKLVHIALRYRYSFLVQAALGEVEDKAGITIPVSVRQRLHNPLAMLERLEARTRLSKPSSLSVPEEMLLALQNIRRRSGETLKKSALSAVPTLIKSLFGPLSADRSFIDNDRKEQVTLLQGWSAPEATGRWTEGKFASFALYAPHGVRPSMLTVRGFPLPRRPAATQVVNVYAGWRRIGTLRWPKSGRSPYAQAIRLPSFIWCEDTAVIRFRIRTPISPIETGLNGDTRALGIFVEHLAAEPAVLDVPGIPLDLSSSGSDVNVLWHGWSRPEPHGCWSIGPLALLHWRAARDIARKSALRIDIANVAPGSEELRGQLLVNDRRVESFRYPAAKRDLLIQLPIPMDIAAGELVEIKFEIDNPRSPAKILGTADKRPLGLCIRQITIDPPSSQS